MADIQARTVSRPWGPNNPVWQLYAYGSFEALLNGENRPTLVYVLALVGDDGMETDGDPTRDGSGADNPGKDVLAIRGDAYTSAGGRAAIDMLVRRQPDGSVRTLSWRRIQVP
jgi:hypothetical protein